MRKEASKARAEADAITRAGWDIWKAPLAPRADGTRKAVYQNKARATFFDTIGLAFWGLQARMQQSLESARVARLARGQTITRNTGLNTQEMKAWRSIGRTLEDIRILVFNIGRVDFRKKNLAAYALDCQLSLNMVSAEAAYVFSQNMLAAIGALVEMQGIVRMMSQITSGIVFEQRGDRAVLKQVDGGPWGKKHLTETVLWATCKTLLSHRCWRHFPKLASKLPEILLGGSFNGVPLQSQTFCEPGTVPDFQGPDKWKRGAQRREARFTHVLHALSRLMRWAGDERRAFMAKVLGVAPPTSKRVQQGLDLSLPRLENADVDGLHVFDSAVENAGEEAEELITTRCSFVRQAVGSPNPLTGSGRYVDLLTDGILPASTVADAAFDLDIAREKMYGTPVSLGPADIASLLQECAGQQGDADVDADTSSQDSDGDDAEVPSDPVVDRPSMPVVDGPSSPVLDDRHSKAFVDVRDVERLGTAYTCSKRDHPPRSGSINEARQAFLALPKHDWMITIAKGSGKIVIVNKQRHQELWHTRCIDKMPPQRKVHRPGWKSL